MAESKRTLYQEVDELLEQIMNGERDINDLDAEEVMELRKRLNPLGQAIKLEDNTGKLYAYSLINLAEEYQKKFLMTSLIGFLFKRVDEYGVPAGDYVTPAEELDSEELTRQFVQENVLNGKVVLKKETEAGVSGGEHFTQEETVANKFKRKIIHEFLLDCFTHNPDKHVRSAYQQNPADPERAAVTKRKQEKRPDSALSNNEKALKTYDKVTANVPPADLFHHFRTYMDVNYDPLRIATRDLYCDKPDLDYLLIIYQNFNTKEEYNDFVHKHEDDVTAEVRCVMQNQWTFQASFAKNRDRQQFYNKNTRILQEILDMAEAGQKLGKEMMQKRIKIKKQQNVAECGSDDEKFIETYKKEQRKFHKKAGLKEVSAKERAQAELEERYTNAYDKPSNLLDEDEYKDAIQVPIHKHDVRNRKMKTGAFFTKAEEVDPTHTGMTSGGTR